MLRVILISIGITFLFSTLVSANEGIVNPHQTYTYDILKKDLSELNANYSHLLDMKSIGTTPFGRKIFAIKLGKGEKNILFIGSHHGREWMTSSLLMEMLEEYTVAYNKHRHYGSFSTKILDEVAIWFVPMLNPDGVEIQQGHLERFPPYYQRKIKMLNENEDDFTRWKANGLGVDLNRQYPAGWEELSDGPNTPSYQFYKGKHPIEAKEVKVITNFTEKISPLLAVPYHSTGRIIFWKYKNGMYLERDRAIAKKVSKLTNYKLEDPPDSATGGGYTDWFITNFHRPAMTIEICPMLEDSSPPLSVFNEDWERNKYVGLFLANEANKMKK